MKALIETLKVHELIPRSEKDLIGSDFFLQKRGVIIENKESINL